MNVIVLHGRWTRDTELTMAANSGTAILKGSLAVDRRFKRDGEPDADFFRITAFGKTAETISQYAGTKGQAILIKGYVQTGSYPDKNHSDVKHNSFDVLVENFDFVGNKREQNSMNQEDGDIPFV